jgi:hypothetical protein
MRPYRRGHGGRGTGRRGGQLVLSRLKRPARSKLEVAPDGGMRIEVLSLGTDYQIIGIVRYRTFAHSFWGHKDNLQQKK